MELNMEKHLHVGELDEGSQKVQTSSYKTNKFYGCNVHHNHCINT